MIPREMIEIIQAYEQGEEVEWRLKQDSDWAVLPVIENFEFGCEQFDFNNYDYRIKKTRWRAQKGESYFYIFSCGDIVRAKEIGTEFDDDRYAFGNYFQTEEEAQWAADHIKKGLIEFHESN